MRKAVLTGFLIALAVLPAYAAALTEDELKSDFIGKNFAVKSQDGKIQSHVHYNSDGSAEIPKINLPKVSSDTGKWHFKGNEICVHWNKLSKKGQEDCFTVEKQTDGSYLSSTHFIHTPE